jgi:hypothetical protein
MLMRLWVMEDEHLQLGLEVQLTPGWFTLGVPMSAPVTERLTLWARPYASPLSAHVSAGLSYVTQSGLTMNVELGGGVIVAAPLFGLPEDDRVGVTAWLDDGPQRAYPIHLGLGFSNAYTPERRAPPPR